MTLARAMWFCQVMQALQRALWRMCLFAAIFGVTMACCSLVARCAGFAGVATQWGCMALAAFYTAGFELVLLGAVWVVDELTNAIALEHGDLSADDGKERGEC